MLWSVGQVLAKHIEYNSYATPQTYCSRPVYHFYRYKKIADVIHATFFQGIPSYAVFYSRYRNRCDRKTELRLPAKIEISRCCSHVASDNPFSMRRWKYTSAPSDVWRKVSSSSWRAKSVQQLWSYSRGGWCRCYKSLSILRQISIDLYVSGRVVFRLIAHCLVFNSGL